MKKSKPNKAKISYEPEADVLTWELSDKQIYSAKEIGNVVIHFTKSGLPVVMEILEASRFLSKAKHLIEKEPKFVATRELAGMRG